MGAGADFGILGRLVGVARGLVAFARGFLVIAGGIVAVTERFFGAAFARFRGPPAPGFFIRR
jgi:hypothetical protein